MSVPLPSYGDGDKELAHAMAQLGMLVAVLLILWIWFTWKCLRTILAAWYQTAGRSRALRFALGLFLTGLALALVAFGLVAFGTVSPQDGGVIASTGAAVACVLFYVQALVAWVVLIYTQRVMRPHVSWDIHQVLTDWWSPLDAAA